MSGENNRIEEIRKRAETFQEGELGQELTPKERFERGMDFAQLTTEDIPWLLAKVEELDKENEANKTTLAFFQRDAQRQKMRAERLEREVKEYRNARCEILKRYYED